MLKYTDTNLMFWDCSVREFHLIRITLYVILQKTFLFLFTFLVLFVGVDKVGWGQTITVSSLTPSTICAGDNVTVNFSWVSMSNGNETKTFSSQYEDPAGIWNTLGTISITGSGNRNGTASIIAVGPGTEGGFNVRVIRSAPTPQVISSNTLPLTVSLPMMPSGMAASPSAICNGSSSTIL